MKDCARGSSLKTRIFGLEEPTGAGSGGSGCRAFCLLTDALYEPGMPFPEPGEAGHENPARPWFDLHDRLSSKKQARDISLSAEPCL